MTSTKNSLQQLYSDTQTTSGNNDIIVPTGAVVSNQLISGTNQYVNGTAINSKIRGEELLMIP